MLPLLAFAVPLIVRAVPELLMGEFIVGFDPMGYYVPNTILWLNSGVDFTQLVSNAPLIYLLLMGTTSIGAPIIITLKILGPLLLGVLGLAVYFYANKALTWSPKKSLTVALFSTLFFVSLRISWDMFRSELALTFLLLALTLLSMSKIKFRYSALLSLAIVLVVLSHQLVAVIMFAILIGEALRFFLKKMKTELLRLLIVSIPAVLLFVSVLYVNYFVNSTPVMGYSFNFSGGIPSLAEQSHMELVYHNLGFLAFCYLPLMPLLILGLRRFKGDSQLRTWTIWLLIPIVLALISPVVLFLGGVLPYRWILLLTYPLSFFAVHGLSRIKWRWYKIPFGAVYGVILILLSASFMALPNSQALDYFAAYPSYVPKSMLQNTLQLSDCQDTVEALDWARLNMPLNGTLLVHEAFYGWASLVLGPEKIDPYFFGNLTELTQNQQHPGKDNPQYLIWWVSGAGWYGQQTVPPQFQPIHQNGNIAIYRYALNQ